MATGELRGCRGPAGKDKERADSNLHISQSESAHKFERMSNKKHKATEAMEGMKAELKKYHRQNVILSLNGNAASPGAIARACAAAEHGTYMRDYIGSRGKLMQIDFVYVKEE